MDIEKMFNKPVFVAYLNNFGVYVGHILEKNS